MSNKNLHSFFIVLALLFWNPLSFFVIYGGAASYSMKKIHVFYWTVFTAGILVIFLFQKNKLHQRVKNFVFSLACAGVFFSALVIVDRLVALPLTTHGRQTGKQHGLIFEPYSKARYQTTEFDFSVNIDNLGLRDREINIDKEGKFRIMCFGDSFTFGWGVDVEDSWPKKLEKYLLSRGFRDIEVINAGQPGAYTKLYKNSMKKAVPLLNPDLVLVGVLQGDDLMQLYENDFPIDQVQVRSGTLTILAERVKLGLQQYLVDSLGNILRLSRNKESRIVEIRTNWRASATSMIEKFNRLTKIYFSTLDGDIQRLFKTGDLNPALLDYYLYFPDAFLIFNMPEHPATKFAIQEMMTDLREMKQICDRHNSRLIFVNLPTDAFTGHRVVRTSNSVLSLYLQKNNNIDSIYHSIADANGLLYIELTKHFLDLKSKSEYFFRYDGHPNEKGYEEIAGYIGRELLEQGRLRRE